MKYIELDIGKKIGTYVTYKKKCEKDKDLKRFADFKEYDKAMTEKNLNYNIDTYEVNE